METMLLSPKNMKLLQVYTRRFLKNKQNQTNSDLLPSQITRISERTTKKIKPQLPEV